MEVLLDDFVIYNNTLINASTILIMFCKDVKKQSYSLIGNDVVSW
jgi:tyrosine-protein phosphatase YwqE